MKNKTLNNEKRWRSRLLALVGCLLLVSSLAVPCFADGWIAPTQESVGNADYDLYYTDTQERIPTSLYGFYEISFSSLDYSYSANVNTMLIDGTEATVYFAFNDGTDEGVIYEVASVSYDGGSYADGMLIFKTYGDAQHDRIFDAAFDISRVVVYVSTYPGDAYNEEAFINSGTTYTVTKLVQSFTPDDATTIWGQVMAWIANALASIQSVFYLNGSLTFLGTLAVIGVSIGIAFLIIGVVTRFFQLRG